MTNVRRATTQDANAVADIWNAMIRDTLATFTTIEKTTQDIAALIDTRTGAFWVAEQDSVIGFATYGPFRSGPGYSATFEHTVILSPNVQGKGIGRSLMSTLEAAAKAQGAHVLVAGISSANPGAMAFHKRLGFEQTARMPQVGFKAGHWLDLILMQKTISAS